ncbi:MAG: hypothetical protein IKN74_05185 [Clostridia bacterium]|nr:hypothetical protein [Clostridia bacterium]
MVKEENNSKPSLTQTIVIFVVTMMAIFMVARYISDSSFKDLIDQKVFRIGVIEESLKSIEIDNSSNVNVYAYDKYIAVLNKNVLKQYDKDAEEKYSLDIKISMPIVATSGKYMIMAEKGGEKAYLISGENIVWQRDFDGDISRVAVNEKGYTCVILENTTYKSIGVIIDDKGNELFKTFINSAYSYVIDISDNSKYVAMGDVVYSGAIIKSTVSIYSVEKAQTDPNNAKIYEYEAEHGSLILDINYQGNNAICLFNNYVQKVGTSSDERLYDMTNTDVFIETNLKSTYAVINRHSSELFSYEYQVDFRNSKGKSSRNYILEEEVPSRIVANGNKVAMVEGSTLEIIKSNGMLVKKFTGDTTINSAVLGDKIAGVLYKNKIFVIEL